MGISNFSDNFEVPQNTTECVMDYQISYINKNYSRFHVAPTTPLVFLLKIAFLILAGFCTVIGLKTFCSIFLNCQMWVTIFHFMLPNFANQLVELWFNVIWGAAWAGLFYLFLILTISIISGQGVSSVLAAASLPSISDFYGVFAALCAIGYEKILTPLLVQLICLLNIGWTILATPSGDEWSYEPFGME
jgi:hypothetical protein